MRNSTSSLLKGILTSGACAAMALCAMPPAAAHPHDRTTHSTAPARAERAPVRMERAPVRMERAPVRMERAPVRMERAPVRVERAPVRVERAPVRYAAPVRVERVRSAPVRYAAPARVERVRTAPVRYAAPARVERVRHARVAAPAPFVQRVAPERSIRTVRETRTAPFVQYVRTAPRVRREIVTRTVTRSPLLRAVYGSRTRSIPVVYHPRYIAGRIARIRRNEVVIDPPAGAPIVVRDVVLGSAPAAIPAGTFVTLPVTYTNGLYTYAPPVYNGYDYGYAPQYQYAYAPPMYCSGNSSSALYAALLPAVVGVLTGNSNGFSSNGLSSLALAAASGGNDCGVPYYSQPAYAPSAYYTPVTYAPAPVNYASPYDNCLAGDEDGDESCAPSTGYTYGNYSAYSAYTPQQIQGVVIGRTGDMLMVLGANGTPTMVYAAPALQSGYTINGPIAPGQIIDAYGYYNGNTFVATSLV
jgi:hypothetical protein